MHRRRLLSALVVILLFATATPRVCEQTPGAPSPRVEPRDGGTTTPAEKAFRAAVAVRDPEAKLRAMQQLRKDWPESQPVKAGAVDFNILQITTRMVAPLAAEARRAADSYAALSPEGSDDAAWNQMLLAQAFSRTGSMWPEAEQCARKALGAWDSTGSAGPPMRAGIPLQRAVPLTVLGQALTKLGRHAEAERWLAEAYRARATEPGVVGQVVPLLLEYARSAGRDEDRLEYLSALALYGGLTPALRVELADVYRRTRGGSPAALDAMLDARYEAELPKVIAVEPFVRAASPSVRPRTVLAEMFTGASCSPCVGMDLALEAAMRRYRPSEVAILVYHMHSPAPDPLANPSAEARVRAYGVPGAPHLVVDGNAMDQEGGGTAAEAGTIFRSRLQPTLDRGLQVPADASLSAVAAIVGQSVHVTVSASGLPRIRSGLRLQVALVEERVRYSGGNGVRYHPMVVRKLAGDGAGIPVPPAGTKAQLTFDLTALRRELKTYLDTFESKGNANFPPSHFLEKKHDVEASRLLVVTFIEDAASHRVLQAAVARRNN